MSCFCSTYSFSTCIQCYVDSVILFWSHYCSKYLGQFPDCLLYQIEKPMNAGT